ncbi:MAG: DEAD/DEAH box helicase family protein [Thermoanaerobaculia bacterium]
MPSVFTQRPRSEWIANNSLAFAIRDGFPVSPGHTLVVPFREVATWFEASTEERVAIFALIDEVKARLDHDLHPDGYNVGFNAGPAAGQTVPHLHVHVIPRFLGDVPDPRGGVRHTIPGRGNYLVPKVSPLATGGSKDPFLSHIRPLFETTTRLSIVAAFVQDSGLELIREDLAALRDRGGSVRLLTGDYLAITQGVALERLLGWEAVWSAPTGAEPEDLSPHGRLETRVVETARLTPAGTAFHPKSWVFEGKETDVGFVGSSNISRSALDGGIEWNLRVDRTASPEAWNRLLRGFDELWAIATPLTSEWLSGYEERARSTPQALPAEEETEEPEGPIPVPHELQAKALEALRTSRDEGRGRALVVLATGLGKTWLAAFDAAAMAQQQGSFPRLLFVAHRSEILEQAAATFGRLARHLGHTPRFSWFVGSNGDLGGDLVFASVQKLSRRESLAKLDAQSFDYVIVDEVHHATADSYRRVLDHIRSAFVLGLTATPDRADDADVRGLFDDHVAFEAGLGVGVDQGLLCPFQYWGLKDTVDYEDIPWRNNRFDLEALSEAAATEARMSRFWEAWQEHAASRSLVFCCSVRHATFVRTWLMEHGVRSEVVTAETPMEQRRDALEELRRGNLDAVCAVDLFNEGIDLPGIDRVAMLRPTESPVLFLQQLGRGLRKTEGKPHLTVIDFVGNHRVFLDRVRLLLTLGRKIVTLRGFLTGAEVPDLPPGCSVKIELEAVDLLRKLLPKGESEVIRAYRELRTLRGSRPTAGEMYRLGYLPSRLPGWFAFVASENDLEPEEANAWGTAKSWFEELETTAMAKSFKMVVLEALLEADALATGLAVSDLSRRCHALIVRSPELLRDIQAVTRFPDPQHPDWTVWLRYWEENPIRAWTEGPQRRWFRLEGDTLLPTLPVAKGCEAAFAAMTRELVDYRLAQYRQRYKTSGPAGSFTCKVTWNRRDPILKLPSRNERPDLPLGETDVRAPNGTMWRFRFAREFCNVARPVGSDRNQLPDLMRTWFGPRAGNPGTNFYISFRSTPDGLWVEPSGQIVHVPSRLRVPAYPSLRAAAGAARRDTWDEGAATDSESDTADEVQLPIGREDTKLFAVRASGTSMDGGSDPIHDGDWVVLRWARGEALKNLHYTGRPALIENRDASGEAGYQLKRVVREGGRWLLRSNNPDVPDFEGSEETRPIAVVQQVIRPEDLAPPVGALIPDAGLASAFGLDDAPQEGHVGGHLFFFVEGPGSFTAPDRLARPGSGRPAETAFVLARAGAGLPWRYCGVGRWRPEEGTWEVPELDLSTWRAVSLSRGVSRRLPEAFKSAAAALIARALQRAQEGESVISYDDKSIRIVGPSRDGGIRIDGGPRGFQERTISLTDIAWVLAAHQDAVREEGLLDEARVNRLRYLDGTPREATRWIDTNHAIAIVRTALGAAPK